MAVFCVFVTLPHVMEPAYPGSLGHYINLGAFYDRKALRAHGPELVALKKEYQACYARAYQCLRAAREVRHSGEKVFKTAPAMVKIDKRVKGILSREAKKQKGNRGSIRRWFLGGYTCQGKLFLADTVYKMAKRIYELQESCGLAPLMLNKLEEGMVAAGYDVISALSAEDPTKLEHLLVPELSLAFVTTMPHKGLEKRPYRRVRMDTMVEKEVLQANRSKLRFSHRIADGLVEDGIRELQVAKEMHDDLEATYHPHVDFRGVDQVTKTLLEEIKKLP